MASIMFAGLTSVAMADVAALGSILISAMEKDVYGKPFAAAITAASSVISPIISPSLVMLIYAHVMGFSVAALFLAGIIQKYASPGVPCNNTGWYHFWGMYSNGSSGPGCIVFLFVGILFSTYLKSFVFLGLLRYSSKYALS